MALIRLLPVKVGVEPGLMDGAIRTFRSAILVPQEEDGRLIASLYRALSKNGVRRPGAQVSPGDTVIVHILVIGRRDGWWAGGLPLLTSVMRFRSARRGYNTCWPTTISRRKVV